MAALTCIYTDPKKVGDGPRLYLSSSGWTEDPQKAIDYSSLSTANRPHQVPIGYQPSQSILAEVIKVHPSIHLMRATEPKLQELFPQATLIVTPPKHNPQMPWYIEVKMPPEKRSFVVGYRYWHGYWLRVFDQAGNKSPGSEDDYLKNDELMLLRAINLSEPLTCHCDCHGPSHGFFHSWGGDCCHLSGEPRTNADLEARRA